MRKLHRENDTHKLIVETLKYGELYFALDKTDGSVVYYSSKAEMDGKYPVHTPSNDNKEEVKDNAKEDD